jgi:RES domain-containing protein
LSEQRRTLRDPHLLDHVQAIGSQPLQTKVWRITRAGRNPLLASSPKGRWDDGSFDVLYTALAADTARAELYWHLTRGQPVFPSGLRLHLHELHLEAAKALVLDTPDALQAMGLDMSTYGNLGHARLQAEYSVSQQIGEAACFLGYDALVVPSARWPANNLVIITGNLAESRLSSLEDHGHQDLRAWAMDKNL